MFGAWLNYVGHIIIMHMLLINYYAYEGEIHTKKMMKGKSELYTTRAYFFLKNQTWVS